MLARYFAKYQDLEFKDIVFNNLVQLICNLKILT